METTEISVITDEIDPNKESDITVHEENLMIPKGIEVYEINGPYFFGIATKFEETMTQLGDRPKVRIIRMRKVPYLPEYQCSIGKSEKSGRITLIISHLQELYTVRVGHIDPMCTAYMTCVLDIYIQHASYIWPT